MDLLIDQDIDPSEAEQNAIETLLSFSDIEQRALMQPISRSEIMAQLSRINGVLNVTVRALGTLDGADGNASHITAYGPRWSTQEGRILPAEFLVLRRGHINLRTRRVGE